jgi:hypothetical protein
VAVAASLDLAVAVRSVKRQGERGRWFREGGIVEGCRSHACGHAVTSRASGCINDCEGCVFYGANVAALSQ